MQKKHLLETEHLILRPFSMEDVPKLFDMSQEEGMAQWVPDQVYEDEEETTEVVEFLMAQYKEMPTPDKAPYVIGIVLKETGELIGHVGLSPLGDDVEIGYAIAENQQGHGYATEAITAMTEWALKNLGLSIILGVVDSENKGSWRVLERAGYTFVEEEKTEAFGRYKLCRVYKKAGR